MAGKRILIVEDEPDLLRVIAYALEQEGHETLIASSGARARELLDRDLLPDLVLLDLMLPDASGVEICQEIRRRPRTRQVPVVMVTALGAEPDRLRGFDAGADDYVVKPFSTRELVKRVAAHLRRSRARREELIDALLPVGLPAGLRRMLGQIRPGEAGPATNEQSVRAALALGRAMDARDPYTKRHSEKVAAFALVLGRQLGLSSEALGELRLGGLLHDVGKIGVADAILLKPAGLEPEEMKTVRAHPHLGATIIEPIGFSANIRSIVACHHERFDGSGYPNGLAGDRIPPLARIVQLVDTYEAMSADRIYRAARTAASIREELTRLRGRWYDPLLVDSLIGLMGAGVLDDVRRRLEAFGGGLAAAE